MRCLRRRRPGEMKLETDLIRRSNFFRAWINAWSTSRRPRTSWSACRLAYESRRCSSAHAKPNCRVLRHGASHCVGFQSTGPSWWMYLPYTPMRDHAALKSAGRTYSASAPQCAPKIRYKGSQRTQGNLRQDRSLCNLQGSESATSRRTSWGLSTLS